MESDDGSSNGTANLSSQDAMLSNTRKFKVKNVSTKPKLLKDANLKISNSISSKRATVSNNDIMSYMETFQSNLMRQANTINMNIDQKLDKMQSDFMAKLNLLDVTVDERIKSVTSSMEARIEPMVMDVVGPFTKAIESRIENLERESLLLELVVSGIPLHPNEKLGHIVDKMCTSIGFTDRLNGLSGFYRMTRTKKNAQQENAVSHRTSFPQIKLKFWNFGLKQEFFKRYMIKKSLSLADLGYKTTSRVYINESLTSSNQKLFLKARMTQRNKIIYQCHTYRGQVFIRLAENSSNKCIGSMDELLIIENSDLNLFYIPQICSHQYGGVRSNCPLHMGRTKPRYSASGGSIVFCEVSF
ncbi:hypothetical protein Bhyg_05488, partial [Pseudolycoriella hygida]